MAVVALLVLGSAAVLATRAHLRSAPSPTRSPAPIAPAPAPTPSVTPVPPTATGSDQFDGWAVADGGAGTRFLGSDQPHDGQAALLVVRPAGDAPANEPTVSQTITVAQDSHVRLSFWAASTGSAGDGAVQVRIGSGTPAVVALPATASDWTRYTADWTVPPKVTTTTITIAATNATSGTRIDDVAVQGQGSRGVRVADDGFETSSAAVVVIDTSLVQQRSGALHLRSRLAPTGAFTWRAEEYTGGAPIAGHGRFSAGEATLPLSALPTGYYRLTLYVPTASGTVGRTTDLVVAAPRPADASAPLLGVGVHLGAGDPQLQQKVRDLASLGLRAARTDADWGSIERTRGQYDFSGPDPVVRALQQAGLRPLLIPDYSNGLYDKGRTPSSPDGTAAYARFTAALAAHYPDADIDVYNEFDWRFNSSACGPTPQCYLSLIGPTATAVRAVQPRGAIAGPDISGIGVQQPWLQGFIDGGGLGSIDALDVHPYVQPARPDVLDDQLAALQASLMAAGKPDEPVWFTEFGDSTADGWLSERRQAEDAARVFGVAAAHGVDRVYWYDAIDDGPDPADLEHRFGLFRAPTLVAPGASVPKPAAAVLATDARLGAGRPGGTSMTEAGVRTIDLGGVTMRWSVDDEQRPADPVSGATSMTGRPVGRSAEAGSAPVWSPSTAR